MSDCLTVPIGTAHRATLVALATARRPPQGDAGRIARVVGSAVGRVELLRVDGGGLARVRGWWGPAGLLLHRTSSAGASHPAPYVLAPAADLPDAVLRALKAGGLRPAPHPVRVGPVGEVLAVARGQDRAWLRELGASSGGQVALVRWEALAGGVDASEEQARLLAVRAVLLTPAGAVRLAADAQHGGVALLPTDAAAELEQLRLARDVLAAAASGHLAEVARGALHDEARAR